MGHHSLAERRHLSQVQSREKNLAKIGVGPGPAGSLVAGKAERPPGTAQKLTHVASASIGDCRDDWSKSAGFAVGLVIITAIGVSSYVSTQRLIEANRSVTHTHEVIEGLEHILSLLKDAETGQRGFILAGEERYLEPYLAATAQVQHDIDALGNLTRDNSAEQESLQQVHSLSDAKLAELQMTIQLRRKSGPEAVLQVILTDRGKKPWMISRSVVTEMETRERHLLDERNDAANQQAQPHDLDNCRVDAPFVACLWPWLP